MKKVAIKLDDEEYETLEKRVKEKKEFNSVESYVQDIVTQVVNRLREENSDQEELSQEDEEKVKERLRSLGYLD